MAIMTMLPLLAAETQPLFTPMTKHTVTRQFQQQQQQQPHLRRRHRQRQQACTPLSLMAHHVATQGQQALVLCF